MNGQMMEQGAAPTQMPSEGMQGAGVDGALVTELIQTAKELLYGDNFDSMLKVFQTAGKQGFAEAMATVVLGTLQRLEQDAGEQDPRTLLVVVIGLVAMLTTDLSEGAVIEGLNSDDVQLAIQACVGKWLRQNPDRGDAEGVQQQVAQAAQQGRVPKPPQPPQGMPPQGGQQQPPGFLEGGM